MRWRLFWHFLKAGYRFIAYWLPLVWIMNRLKPEASWWGSLAALLAVVLAWACTLHLFEEPDPPPKSEREARR